jgi:muconolactone D-isomerase
MVEYLVNFKLEVPVSVSEVEIDSRMRDEALATKKLADDGHLVRLWRTSVNSDHMEALGLFRAGSVVELTRMLGALPLSPWLTTTITRLERHSNDPGPKSAID